MSQSPLAPPPQTGQPIDSWLYLLWRRLTATGQMLWSSIVPGSSADVAAVVTDETGSPGSLVFSGNPTLAGVTVNGVTTGNLNAGTAPSPAANTVLHTIGIDGANNTFQMTAFGGANAIRPVRANGTPAASTALVSGNQLFATNCLGYDGSAYSNQANWIITAAENWSGSAKGTAFAMNLTPNGSTNVGQKWAVQGDGTATFGGTSTSPALSVIPDATPSTQRHVLITAGAAAGNPTIGVSGGILAISASVAITGVVSTSGYTVAGLPAGTVGQRAYVTDALAPAYGVAVAGGGAATVPVFYNGAAWICA